MKNLTPLKSIRVYCLECSGSRPKEIRYCPSSGCPLYLYRFGTNPHRKGVGPGAVLLHRKSFGESAKIEKEAGLKSGSANPGTRSPESELCQSADNVESGFPVSDAGPAFRKALLSG